MRLGRQVQMPHASRFWRAAYADAGGVDAELHLARFQRLEVFLGNLRRQVAIAALDETDERLAFLHPLCHGDLLDIGVHTGCSQGATNLLDDGITLLIGCDGGLMGVLEEFDNGFGVHVIWVLGAAVIGSVARMSTARRENIEHRKLKVRL